MQIQRLRELLLTPPEALGVLGTRPVATLEPSSTVRQASALIAEKNYTQIPVYDDGGYVQLLTGNAIARWVAADLGDNGQIDAGTVGEVLEYAEPAERVEFAARDASAQEVVDLLSEVARDGSHAVAVILTEQGKRHQRPLRIITGSDLGKLLDALDME